MAHAGFSKQASATQAMAQKHADLMKEQRNRQMAAGQFLNYGGATGFGGRDDAARTVFAPGKRRRINIVSICINVFLPFLLFAILYCAMSFKFHYKNPALCWSLALIVLGAGIAVLVYSERTRKRDREPGWLQFTGWAIIFAAVTATVFGNLNYLFNLLPYYEIDSLNTYPSVNPKDNYGQELQDAGRMYFAEGTKLDMKKAVAFKNTDLYCAVPIINTEEKLSHYDFWAVGMNCCSGVSADFRCGQFNNPKARSGLRSVWDGQRPFYRLAVQMASAQFNLNSPHPLFFTWVQDPVEELEQMLARGWRYYLLGISCHFAFNLFATLSATVLFSKIGYM